MDPDLTLCIGLIVVLLSLPAVLSAWSDNRPPRSAALALVIGGGLVVYAIRTKPGGYAWEDLPSVIYGVIGQLIG
ncbi:hypothetical protein [Puniceibacterium confluentis]|uniref:hypothetical protein n=1 Tax=Puniceibacterium confluentis TaxID=1958944 RepID=UPI0011B4422B|nr:hypothetical protein [Puniceibacterium confluentis]